jgi:hypothetical protein
MLDAYEAERQPITEQVSRFAMDHAAEDDQARAVPCRSNIEADDTEGRCRPSARAIGQEAYELNVQQFCCAGLNFGYFYSGSPLIVADGEAPPAYTMGGFTPNPLCRAAGRPTSGWPTGGPSVRRVRPGLHAAAAQHADGCDAAGPGGCHRHQACLWW